MIIFHRKGMIISLGRIDDPMKVAESIGTKDIVIGIEIVIINQGTILVGNIQVGSTRVETILVIIRVGTIRGIIQVETIQAETTQEETIKVETMEVESILLVITEVEIIIVGMSLLLVNLITCKITVTMIRNRQCIYDSSFNGQLQCERDVSFSSSCVGFKSTQCRCEWFF